MTPSPYDIVTRFEQEIANYAGSPYAVAVDTCTAALQLCLEYFLQQCPPGETPPAIQVPAFTFCGVPAVVAMTGCRIRFDTTPWQGAYRLHPTPIIDSACQFRSGMYEPGTLRCLSFQYRKHLPIGRGGMILTDDIQADRWLRTRRSLGRDFVDLSAAAAVITLPVMLGWQMSMEPERAARGLSLLQMWPRHCPVATSDRLNTYQDLRNAPAFLPYRTDV